jgi:hypothetical protein
VNDDSNDQEEFILIKELEIQNPPPSSLSSRRRRRNFYISDSNDEEINEEISVEEIDGEEAGGEKADKPVNMEEDIEEIIEKIGEKIVRTRSDKEMKRARISLPYHGEMEYRRKEGLGYRAKFKIARRRRG